MEWYSDVNILFYGPYASFVPPLFTKEPEMLALINEIVKQIREIVVKLFEKKLSSFGKA